MSKSTQPLRVAYDRPVDVLRVVQGPFKAYEGDGGPNGLEFDYSVEDNTATGAKVIGFKRNGWSDDLDRLAILIGNHLSRDATELKRAIRRAVQTRR